MIMIIEKRETEKELKLYCKSHQGEAKLSRATQKLREKADFAWKMDREAFKKGETRMSKAEAKAKALLDLETEMYDRNIQKVTSLCLVVEHSRDDNDLVTDQGIYHVTDQGADWQASLYPRWFRSTSANVTISPI